MRKNFRTSGAPSHVGEAGNEFLDALAARVHACGDTMYVLSRVVEDRLLVPKLARLRHSDSSVSLGSSSSPVPEKRYLELRRGAASPFTQQLGVHGFATLSISLVSNRRVINLWRHG